MIILSPLRARLASFEHAYAVALQRRYHLEANQFIVRTGDPLQPFRVGATPPSGTETLMALVA